MFVPGALPGERVSAEILPGKKAWLRAHLIAIEQPSPERVTPPCALFGRCGGCVLQHCAPAAQIAAKQQALLESLWHIGRVRPIQVLPALQGQTLHWRRRVRWSARALPSGFVLGLRAFHSSYVQDAQGCPLLLPALSDLLGGLHSLLASLKLRAQIPGVEAASAGEAAEEQVALTLHTLAPLPAEDRAALAAFAAQSARPLQWWQQSAGARAAAVPLQSAPPLAYHLPQWNLRLQFAPQDFIQAHGVLNRELVAAALEMLAPQPGERALDWFCGIGNFTLPLARCCKHVTGVEGHAGLVERALGNAVLNGLSNAEFVREDIFAMTLEHLRARFNGAQIWLLDPPREGALDLVKSLCALSRQPCYKPPERILYVSCNPATLARDAGLLVHRGGYRCQSVRAADMFPHSTHSEALALFVLSER